MFDQVSIEVRTRTDRDARPPIHTAQVLELSPAALHFLQSGTPNGLAVAAQLIGSEVMALLRRGADVVAADQSVEELEPSASGPRDLQT